MAQWARCEECGAGVTLRELVGHRFYHRRQREMEAAGGPEAYVEKRLRAEGKWPE